MATVHRYVLRGDNAEAWDDKNPVLLKNELGYDQTNRRIKFGDGKTVWDKLPYVRPDVIDDLVTGGTDDALSAEQGKNLKGSLTRLEQTIQEIVENGGIAPAIEIGNVSTLKAGSDATVSINEESTASKIVLDFGIPRGATGNAGTTPNIQVQPYVNVCDDPKDAKVVKTGSVTQPVLEFTLPRGPKGEDGSSSGGTAATITIGTTTTGAAGTNASVTNVGTATNAVLNFTIPRGATGATGATGTSGYSTESWTFTLESGGTVIKKVVLS